MIVNIFTDSYENAIKHFGIQTNQANNFGLDDDDIDFIQEILDESADDDDDDDDDVEVLLDDGNEFPHPIKIKQKQVE